MFNDLFRKNNMAAIRHSKSSFVVISGDRFLHFFNGKRSEYQLSRALVDQQKNSEEERPDVTKTDSENYVLAAGFSCSGKYFALADNHKQLHVYKTSPELELVGTRPLQRRCTALTFTHSETDVLIADRTGDVYRYSLEEPNEDGELILGLLSMILDVKLTPDDRYVLTCDRDEKVRISHYPNAYNIHSYCLSHSEYVSQIVFVSKLDCLISGSGDGSLVSWSLDGKKMDGTSDVKVISEDIKSNSNHGNTEDNIEENIAGVKKIIYDEMLNLLAVSYYRCKIIGFYSLNKCNNTVKLEKHSDLELTEEPWDICYSPDQRLWVLQPSETSPVSVYKCEMDTETSQVSITVDDCCCKTEVTYLNSSSDFFKASFNIQSDTISLQKIKTDNNMRRYLERKEERIKGEEEKKKQMNEDSLEIPEKRLKMI